MSLSRNTKFVVILGYIVMVALAIVGIIWIYLELLNFSKKTELPLQQKELVVLSNTLATLYQSEGIVGLQAIATDPSLNQEYDSLMTTVFHQIDSLNKISSDDYLNNHLDSLNVLLLKKQKNIKELVRLIGSYEKNTIKEITQTVVLTQKDMNFLDSLLVNSMKQFEDTTVIVGEKKSFFRRIGDAIKSNRPDTITQISSRALTTTEEVVIPTLKDTIVEFIQEVNQTAQKKNAAIFAQLMKRQNELYAVNEMTTSQINEIMGELEAKEYRYAVQMMDEKMQTIERSSRIVSFTALAAIIIAVFFMSWIIRSISAAQRLHREIEVGKKNVEKLLASREQVMRTITHDIKAPIGSIIGYLELMMKDKPSAQDAFYIENMQHSASHILNLVKDLLDFHFLDINQQKICLLLFSPAILARDIYESFIPVAEEKELKMKAFIDIDEEANYLSDPYRIRQIVNNILSNAIKFNAQKGAVTFFASLKETKKDLSLIIAVKDTGSGIKEEDKEVIFEEFKRLDYSGVETEGSGLGLNISAKLAQLLGGTIHLDSIVGKGSVFTVVIPLHPVTDFESFEKENPLRVSDEKKALPLRGLDKSQLKILFIDDDIVHLNLISELLKREGIIACTCSGSLEALELLQRKRFDIIFSDIQMPDMNGFEMLERIRMSDFEGSNVIPIVGLSANSHLSESEYKEAGFCEFLAKPFTPEQLFEIIYKYTGKGNVKIDNVFMNEKKGFSSLLRFAGGDPDAEKLIIQSFIDENKKNVMLLTQAFNKNDWETVKKIAHKMQPLLNMVSAQEIISILEDYERGDRSKEKQVSLVTLILEKLKEAENFL